MSTAHQRGMSEGYNRGQLRYDYRENHTKQTETYPDDNQAEISPGSIPRLSHVVGDAIQDQSSSMSLRANFEDSSDQYMIEYQDDNNMAQDPNTLDEFAYTGHTHKGLFPTQPKHSFEQQQQMQQHHLHQIKPIKKSQWLGGENPVVWVQKQLHAQYFDIFNFYFAKGINEILANLNISHVILFKDYLFLDDDSEYLKRYYFKHEVPPRFNLLADFYTNQYKQTRPNLCTIGPAKIIAKRNYKQAKLFVKNQERMYKIMNGENPNEQGNAEEDGEILAQSNNEQEGGEESTAGGRRRKRLSNLLDELDQPTDHSACQDTYTLSSQNNPLQTELQEDVTEKDTSTSFESRSHDIYYPSFSSNGENSNDKQNLLNTQKSIEKKEVVLKQLPQIYADVFVSNANIRPRGCFMASPMNSASNDLRDQKLEKQVVVIEYNELADIEMDLPDYLQVYLNQGTTNPLNNSDKPFNTLEIPQKQGIALVKTLESTSSASLALPLKRIKPLTIKSYDEESKQEDNLGIHVASVVMAPNSARTNGSVRQRDDRMQSRHNNNINSSGLSQTQPTNSGAVRGALLAEYLSQENPLSCRASSTLLNSQFTRNGGDHLGHQGLLETIVKAQQQQQFQQQQSSSLLNRLPANMRKQLALNLQENDQISRNLRQNDASPDRIWTDRDVNPRPSAYPNGSTAVIGKGELRLIKNGKSISSNLQDKDSAINTGLAGSTVQLGVASLEKKQILSRISEDPLEKHTHPAITNILLNAIAKSNSNHNHHHHHLQNTSNNPHSNAINNQHNPNSTSTTPNSHNTNTQLVISSANNSNVHSNNINNNSSSNNLQAHSQNYSQKAMQLKIIQNAVSNQVARISSQTSNVQDVYKKYQQMVMEEQNQQQQLQQLQQQQNFMARTSQELQSFRSSGSSNSLHNFQPMSFFKASRNPQGGVSGAAQPGGIEESNNNGQESNIQMSQQFPGINNQLSQQYQQLIQSQNSQGQLHQLQSYQSGQLTSLENSTSKHGFPEGILMGSTTTTVPPVSSQSSGGTRYGNNSNKAKMNAVIAKAASHGLSAVATTTATTPQNHVGINKRIIGSPNNSNAQLKQTSMVKANKSTSTIQPLKEYTKSIRTSSLSKNLSGDELGGHNNNIMNICMNINDSSTQKTARQTPQAQSRKTPNYSTQNDKIFFTSINNNSTKVVNSGITGGLSVGGGSSLKHSTMNLPSTKNANSKTIHAANSYVSPSNARATHSIGNQLSSKQLSSPTGTAHKSYQDSHQTSLERNRQQQHHFNVNNTVSGQQQPLTRGFIDLNSFTSNLNPTPVSQQTAIILPFNQGTAGQQQQSSSRNNNNNNSKSNMNRTNNPHLSSNNNNTSGNLTSSINIHNINNNININNINVPEISGQSNLSVNTLTMNNLNVNQINLANFMQNTQHEHENGLNNPTIQNTVLTQQGSSENQILTRNTQHTQGNPGLVEESSKTNSPMAVNHKQQKSDGLIKSNSKINKGIQPQPGAGAIGGASSMMGIPFDTKSPRQNQLNVQQSQIQQTSKQPSPIPQQQGQQNQVSQSNSQLRKQELKLNISKIINQQQEYTQNICSATNYNNTERNVGSSSSSSLNPTGKGSNLQFLNEENQENSYGFWTSRSVKQGPQQLQSNLQGQSNVNSINSLKYSSLMASKNNNNNNNNNNPNSVERKQGTNTNNGVPDYLAGSRLPKKDPQVVHNNNNNLISGSSSNHQQVASQQSNNYNFGAFSERGLSHKSPSHAQKQNSLKPSPQIRNHSNNNNNNIPASSSVVKNLQLPISSNITGKGSNLLGSNGRKSPTCIEDVLAYKKSVPSVQPAIMQTTTKR